MSIYNYKIWYSRKISLFKKKSQIEIFFSKIPEKWIGNPGYL